MELKRSIKASGSQKSRLLLLLIGVILLGPYLPSGLIEGRLRLDHYLLPILAIIIYFKKALDGRILFPVICRHYFIFMLWLVAITFVIIGNPVEEFPATSPVAMIAGLDSFLRPFLILFIIYNIKTSQNDLMAIVKFLLIASIPLIIIGVLQKLPSTSLSINNFLLKFYTNHRVVGDQEVFFRHMLDSGRVMSIFTQFSTFGMFCTLCLGLLGAHLLGARIIQSGKLLWIIFVLTITGGVISGSKVFTGCSTILFILFMFRLRLLKRFINIKNFIKVFVTLIILYSLISYFFPDASFYFSHRFRPGSMVREYIGARFLPVITPSTVMLPKVVRTGAVDVVLNYPLTGLGFTAYNRTTDSGLLGILVIGGAIGGFLYLILFGSLFKKLYMVARRHPISNVSALSWAMLFLGIAFFTAQIGFPAFIQDRVGDAYWFIVGILISPGIRRYGFDRRKVVPG